MDDNVRGMVVHPSICVSVAYDTFHGNDGIYTAHTTAPTFDKCAGRLDQYQDTELHSLHLRHPKSGELADVHIFHPALQSA